MEGRVLTVDDLAGSYWIGDGLGFNWSIDLAADRTFTAEQFGCMGVYDNACGTWSMKAARIDLLGEPEESLPGVMRDIRIFLYKDWFLLVPDCFRDEVEQNGPSRWSCFYPEAAADAFCDPRRRP